MRLTATALLLLALVQAVALSRVHAAAGVWDRDGEAAVRLVSAVDGVGALATLRAGLQFELQPGWKINWRSPGDAGMPPQVDWSASENLTAANLSWPVPERFSIFGFETLGYRDSVVLPLVIEVERPGEAVRLRAEVRYLACNEICIPHTAQVALDLPAGPAAPGVEANLIDRFGARVPGDGAAQGLSVDDVRMDRLPDGARLTVVARSVVPFRSPDLFVEGTAVPFGRPEVSLGEDSRTATLRLSAHGADVASLSGVALTLTLADGQRGMETVVDASFADADTAADPLASGSARFAIADGDPFGPGDAADAAPGLPLVVLLALLGGAILNLMPCVLPVLSLKLLAAVSHGGGQRGAVRVGFLASAAGIVASMLAIGLGLVALKAAGMAVGWGIQFQAPVFLAAMVGVLALFAANLFGLFEVALPAAFARLGTRAGGARSEESSPAATSLGGHFATGAFATLLATPCSAPFLGTAVGFALSRGTMEILIVFAALGAGLAAPYLLVAALPWLATALPRPGPWMVWLRRALGLALAGTALWLLDVLATQAGMEAAFSVGALAVLAAVVLGLRRLPESRLGRHGGKVAALLLAVSLLVPVVREAPDQPKGQARAPDGLWQRFDRQAIAPLVAGGSTVFVDVTADWCITCKVNKTLVLDRPPVSELLARPNVVAMRADWTRPDDAIASYLAAFGRYGIPFNVVYGPGAPEGLPLPELLGEATVRASFAAADGARPAQP